MLATWCVFCLLVIGIRHCSIFFCNLLKPILSQLKTLECLYSVPQILKIQLQWFYLNAALLSFAFQYMDINWRGKRRPYIVCLPPLPVFLTTVYPFSPPSSFSINFEPLASEVMIFSLLVFFLSLLVCNLPYFLHSLLYLKIYASVIAVVTWSQAAWHNGTWVVLSSAWL